MVSILGNSIRKPDVTFYRSGRIDINAHAAKTLSLHAGDVIDVMANDDELYLYVRHRHAIGKYEAQCYTVNKHKVVCNCLRAHSAKLCRAILNICRVDSVAKLPIGEPRQLDNWGLAVPLITRHVIQR